MNNHALYDLKSDWPIVLTNHKEDWAKIFYKEARIKSTNVFEFVKEIVSLMMISTIEAKVFDKSFNSNDYIQCPKK